MIEYTFPPQENQSQEWYWFNEGFSRQELDSIAEGVANLEYNRAVTSSGEEQDIRRSNIKWIPKTQEWEWLYSKLMNMAVEANNELWHFDLHSAPELIQYTEYESSELGKYDWHQDIGPGKTSIRKISITVQLSDSDDYEGGDLCIWNGGEDLGDDNITYCPRGAGNVVIFPSYLYHAVKPVSKGTRKSFVLWLGGGHYK